jgi:hypothetical protein
MGEQQTQLVPSVGSATIMANIHRSNAERGIPMKVTAWFKSGRPIELEVPETSWSKPTVAQAIEWAKDTLKREGHDLSRVDHFEAEEDFC